MHISEALSLYVCMAPFSLVSSAQISTTYVTLKSSFYPIGEIIVLCLSYPFMHHNLGGAFRQKSPKKIFKCDFGADIMCFPFLRNHVPSQIVV